MPKPFDTPEAAEFDARVIGLRKQGLTFREIADEVDRTVSHVYKSFQRGLKRITAPNVNEYREAQLLRIESERAIVEDILLGLHVTVSNGRVFGDIPDSAPVLAAIDRLIKLDAQEADLLGLKAATKMSVDAQVSYTVGGGVDPGAMS